MKEIYIVIDENPSEDTHVYPFTDKDKAISEARKAAKKYARRPEEYVQETFDGWLFYARYGCEGECIRVVATTLDKEIKG